MWKIIALVICLNGQLPSGALQSSDSFKTKDECTTFMTTDEYKDRIEDLKDKAEKLYGLNNYKIVDKCLEMQDSI